MKMSRVEYRPGCRDATGQPSWPGNEHVITPEPQNCPSITRTQMHATAINPQENLMPVPSTPRIDPLPLKDRDPDLADLLHRANGSVEGKDLRVFATLARHPSLLKKWLPFAFILLGRGTLPAWDREVLVLRAGWNCRAPYEWGQHIELGKAAGLTDEDISNIARGAQAGPWNKRGELLVRVADELAEHHVISGPTWEDLTKVYDTEQLVEIPMVVGHYTMLAYVLNSLGVTGEPGMPGFA